MDSGVTKYGIIVKSKAKEQEDLMKTEEVLPVVEYFTDLEEALKWI